MRDSLHERGLKYVTEAMATGKAMIGDAMEMKARADIPMGEYWLPYADFVNRNYIADLRDTAAVAHIYGKKIASAESITSTGIPYAYGPWDDKPAADENPSGRHQSVDLACLGAPAKRQGAGIGSRPVRDVVQPPGNMGGAGAGVDGLHCAKLLPAAARAAVIDVAYFYGEEGPATTINQAHAPEITDGYNYDFVNKESLLNEFSVEGGKLVTKSGMKYQLLYLGGTSNRMTLPVLEKLRALVAAGAVVVGMPPVDSPSLSDDVTRWKAAARDIWPDKSLVRKLGQGKVYQTMNLGQVLGHGGDCARLLVCESFLGCKCEVLPSGGWQHGHLLCQQPHRPADRRSMPTSASPEGRRRSGWRTWARSVQPPTRIHDGVTTVPLTLEPRDAVFVVFREPAKAMSRTVAAPSRMKLAGRERAVGMWSSRRAAELRNRRPLMNLSDWSESAPIRESSTSRVRRPTRRRSRFPRPR